MADASRCIFIQVTDTAIFFRSNSFFSPAPASHSCSLHCLNSSLASKNINKKKKEKMDLNWFFSRFYAFPRKY